MDKKFPMTGKNNDSSVKVEIAGLDEIFASALDSESLIGKYERFAEHILLSCAMPEIPRYTVHDDTIDGTMMPQAFDALDRLLVRYRKMTRWMRQNGIDPEAVAGTPDEGKAAN
jgi:hypothetical protein